MVVGFAVTVTATENTVETTTINDGMNLGGIGCITTAVYGLYGIRTSVDVYLCGFGIIHGIISRLVAATVNRFDGKAIIVSRSEQLFQRGLRIGI